MSSDLRGDLLRQLALQIEPGQSYTSFQLSPSRQSTFAFVHRHSPRSRDLAQMPACLIALWEGCWNRRNAGTSGRRLAWRPSSSFCRPRLDAPVRTAQVPSADRTLHGYQELFQFLPRQPERGAHRSTGYRTETSAGRLVSLAGSCMRKGQAGCLGA